MRNWGDDGGTRGTIDAVLVLRLLGETMTAPDAKAARCPTCHKFNKRPDKAIYPNRYRWACARVGLQVPEIEMQFAPLCWEIGFGFSREKIAMTLGPVRVALWFRIGGFVRDAESEWAVRP